jgi:hypothetical protein
MMKMTLEFDELPRVVQERMIAIEKTIEGTTRQEIMQVYEDIFNLDFIVAAPTEERRHFYASQKLHADFLARPKLSTHSIVPCGKDGVTRYGEAEPQQTFFAYHIGIAKLISIRADRKSIPLVNQLTIGECYEDINLVLTDAGNYLIDDRAKLPSPSAYLGAGEDYPESIDDLLTNYLNIRQLQMKDFGNLGLMSKRTQPNREGRTFAINTDWVCVRDCYVISNRKYPVKDMDGVFRGFLMVTDGSLNEEISTDRGITISPQMGVWVEQNSFYPASSLLDIWGTVEHRKWQQDDRNDPTKKIERQSFQMNAYYVFPKGIGPDEDKT